MAKKPAMIRDEAVAAKTGKTWAEWFALLDRAGARQMTHQQIVACLVDRHGVGPWWQQMIAVTYEQQRGLRRLHQRPEGYQVSASRTIAAPAARLYRAWTEARTRRRWLPGARLKITTAKPNRTLRIRWGADEGRLDVELRPKGAAKTQITVQHGYLPNATAADRMKKYWKERLVELAALLEQ